MNLRIKILSLSIVSLHFFGCVHGTRLKGESKTKKTTQVAKKQPAVKPNTTKTARTAGQATTDNKQAVDLTKVNIPAVVLRLSGPTPSYSAADKAIIDALVGKSKPGSYEEAAIVLAVILESSPVKEEGYEEADLYPQNQIWKDAVKKARTISIETNAKKRKINLPEALATNPLLQSYRVQSLALHSLSMAYTSEAFRQKLRGGVTKNATVWASLSPTSGTPIAPTPGNIANTNPQASNAAIQPALQFGASNFGSDDSVLQLAQTLADRGQFSKSVAKLEELKESSPLYAAAQEKIRETSNRAVQRLRRLAAKAFQSAIPVSDLEAKSKYLKNARNYLETALNNFPNADQLSTVRENLAVINRDLLRISENLEPK